MRIGVHELLLILVIILILFGAKNIPELAKGLGTGLREFRKATKEIESDDEKSASLNASTITQGAVTDDN